MKNLLFLLLAIIISCDIPTQPPVDNPSEIDTIYLDTFYINNLDSTYILSLEDSIRSVQAKLDSCESGKSYPLLDCSFTLNSSTVSGIKVDQVDYDYKLTLDVWKWTPNLVITPLHEFNVNAGECLQTTITPQPNLYITVEFYKDGLDQNHRMPSVNFFANNIVDLTAQVNEAIGAIWLCSNCQHNKKIK